MVKVADAVIPTIHHSLSRRNHLVLRHKPTHLQFDSAGHFSLIMTINHKPHCLLNTIPMIREFSYQGARFLRLIRSTRHKPHQSLKPHPYRTETA